MRVKRFEVLPFTFERVFITGNTFTVFDGVPERSRVVRAGYDHQRDVFTLIVEHQSFGDVKEGDVIPAASFTLRRDMPPA